MAERKYTLSREAHRQRKAASACAAKTRRPATDWKSIRVPSVLAKRIDKECLESGDGAAWRTIERAVDRAFPF